MAAVQPKRATTNRLAERDPQVYHPLDRLRGIIRKYVVIEGVLSAVLFVAVWFTVGLALDYGLFKTLGWDWVRDGARWLRGLALFVALGLFAAILVFRIVRRLNKEFSYPALALVLERKFPKVLGDRLITAVEMADVEAMGRFGYSKDMILATIAEARERVGKVPVAEVFNWRRLWVLGFLAVGLILGTLVFAFASHAIATRSVAPYRFGWKFAHVTGIFAERNVALMNTPWPRRAHIELVGFPSTGELTVGRDAPPPRIVARAHRWVIADRHTPDGWRPLVWSDLSDSFLGRPVPQLPPAVLAVTSGEGERTVDSVERLVYETDGDVAPDVAKFRAALKHQMSSQGEGGAAYEELQEVFRALVVKADAPSMGRTLRRLETPTEVTYHYSGGRTGGSGTLSPQQNNEFAGEIGGLKEDVLFVVRGDDYESGARKIRLIAPPTLRRLGRDQAEPAYLHHASPQNEGYNTLENQLQKVAAKDLSLTGDRTVFVVPAGTELTINAEAYRGDDETIPDTDRIVTAHAIPVAGRFPGTVFDDKAKPTQAPVPLKVAEDGSSFSIGFREQKFTDAEGKPVSLPKPRAVGNDFASVGTAAVFAAMKKHTDFRLTENVEFKVVWANKYNVTTTRSFLIQVLQDQPPTVEVAVDTIRKSGNFYLVTPKARIPFNPDSFVKDDRGLSKVEYTFSYWAEDSDVVRGIRTKYALRSLLDTPLPGSNPTAFLPRLHAENFRLLDKADDRLNSSVFVGEFSSQDRQLVRDTRDEFLRRLAVAKAEDAAPPAVKKIELKNPDRDYFDLKELHDLGILNIAAKGSEEVQGLYRMDLNVQATDTNVDGDAGPRVVRNAEPIRLRIVSDSDLLIEIGREVDLLAGKLDEALLKLAAAKKKYDFVRSQYDSVASRYERARPNEQPDEAQKKELAALVDAVKVRALDALQDVEKARDVVQSVVREFRRLTRECEINRLHESNIEHHRKLADSIDAILREAPEIAVSFPKTQGLMTGVQNGLNFMSESVSDRLRNLGDRTPLPAALPSVAVSDAEISLHSLERALRDIREKIGEAQSKEKVKKLLLAVKEEQVRINKGIRELYNDWSDRVNSKDPFLGPTGVVSLKTGGSTKVTHAIEWRQFDSDELTVKVTASDPSITVPAELKLTFERQQFRFDYEIKAGAKKGTFKITLTPTVGKPVEVQVIVD